MRTGKMTVEKGLYLLALVLALIYRFYRLGAAPITDAEAGLALQSLSLARGQATLLGANPAYVLLTTILFFTMESSEMLARFWPAFAGSLLVLAPLLYRRFLGKEAALLLAFLLALDPGLMAFSRQASDWTLAAGLLVFAIGFVLNRQWVAGGIGMGLAMLCGPAFWKGLLILSIASGLRYIYRPAGTSLESILQRITEFSKPNESQRPWRATIVAAVVTILAVGTLFMRVPTGLSAFANSFITFLRGWSPAFQSVILQEEAYHLGIAPIAGGFQAIILGLFFYETLAVILGLWGIGHGISDRDPVDIYLAVWFGVAFGFSLVYPARQVGDVLWILLPLLALAARQIIRLVAEVQERVLPALIVSIPVVVFLIFIWMMYVSVSAPEMTPAIVQQRWVALLLALALLVVTFFLISWGWSLQTAKAGYWLGMLVVLAVYTFSASWNAAGLGKRPDLELWQYGGYVQDEDLLLKTIGDFSEWNEKSRWLAEIAVVNIESPALKWALRGFPNVEFVRILPADRLPALVLTQDQNAPYRADLYAGQDFVWRQNLAWSIMFANDWNRWLAVRVAPSEKSMVLLWVRNTLFPGVK